jgi:small-conductance mechanosensitive channel
MRANQKIIGAVLLALLIATAYGLVRTRVPESLLSTSVLSGQRVGQVTIDQTPLLEAQQLAQMPTTTADLPFAREALRLADHEVDLAFAAAVRDVEDHPPALSPEAKAIQGRMRKAQEALDADKARLDALTAASGKLAGAKKDALKDQLEQAKAQVELDQDEVDDAQEDFVRAGGDTQGRIEALLQQHEASSHSADSTKVSASEPTDQGGLLPRFQQWSALHQKQLLLWRAKQDAEGAVALFSHRHDELEARVAGQKRSVAGDTPVTTNSVQPNGDGVADSETSSAIVKVTKQRAGDRKMLTLLDKRVDTEKQLASIYGKWIGVVAAEQRDVLNHVLRGVAIILAIALIALFFDGWIERLLGRMSLDRRQVESLRMVTRVCVQVTAVVFILLVIWGRPTQLGTFLGLAGAGLTVALKDFIVGFLGWFVLMGKNGIRLGDWVEINGVTGEVVELGMFHTVLLETGNWTDSGHPTGRRVTFTNSFAIEGHYFNFSTAGQWLWDELQIVLPSGNDPYPIVDAIQKKVAEATAETARQAEHEWKGAAKSRKLGALSAAPAINVKPVVGGVEISVRYVTRANERYQLRAQLYEAAVDLLAQKSALTAKA